MSDRPPRRRYRPKSQAPPKQPPFVAILVLLLALGFMLREQNHQAQARPEVPAMQPMHAEAEAELLRLLPPGSRITQALPLHGGSMALAWITDGAARTGIALANPGGGYRLWVAATEQQADVAGQSSIAIIELPNLQEDVLVSTYATEGCCSWVNLFAVGDPPRVLFGSSTSSSRLSGGRILVQKRPLGEYPAGTPMEVESYTWNGVDQFVLSGVTLAPHYYFPLAAGMRWTYLSGDQVVERWVDRFQQTGDEIRFVVRSASRSRSNAQGLPDAIYSYGTGGEVVELEPFFRQLLPREPGVGSTWQMADGLKAKAIAIQSRVRVPAGIFDEVLVVEQGSRRFYFAPHVGLIREEQDGEPLYELLSVNRTR